MSETIADIVAAHKREQGNAVKMTHFDYAVLDVKVGNGEKMHEALKQILALAKARGLFEIQSLSETALAEPPRNCDVGMAEEQACRFYEFCMKHQSGIENMCSPGCPCIDQCDKNHCAFKWAQMTYEEGGEK